MRKIAKWFFWTLLVCSVIGVLLLVSLIGKSINDRALGFGFWPAFWMNVRYYFDFSGWKFTSGYPK